MKFFSFLEENATSYELAQRLVSLNYRVFLRELRADTLAIMLDGECSFRAIAPDSVHIWWGAYVGMPEQIILSGPLSEMADRIVTTRARGRADHGWIMDIYILRRQG